MIPAITVGLVAFGISLLTLFSGFGLGTVLMPVFALFFPLPAAIAATAAVHLMNNFFKVALVGKNANWRVVARFAVPGAAAAIGGALVLTTFDSMPAFFRYAIGSRNFEITAVKLCIGALILLFSVLELMPWFNKLALPAKYLPLGGILSGFFGGLSGHQGALRSAFLVKSGLTKEAFVGTSAVAATIVDTSRLAVYGVSFHSSSFAVFEGDAKLMIIVATIAAFLGSYLGKRLLKKVTVSTIQKLVAVCLMLLGAALGAGLI